MSSVSTFISMFDHFLVDLETTFPEHKKFKSYRMKFDLLKDTNPRLVMSTFLDHVQPLSAYIQQKDESIIENESVQFLVDLDIKSLWISDEMTPNIKDAVWAHLATLLFFGSTISGIPDNVMQNIESLAQQYAGEMDGDGAGFNPALMMQSMSHMQDMMMNMTKK
jgi:hypothetical protein